MKQSGDQRLSPILTGRHYVWLALAFVVLVIYGSLVPFRFRPLPLAEATARFRTIMALGVRIESRSDWAANILLFIPLGYLATAAPGVDRPRRVGLVAAPIVVCVCALLSAFVEFAQLSFPPRVTSLNDVVAESLGAVVGAGLWLAAGQQITARVRRFWDDFGTQGWAAPLLPAYLVFLVLVHAMPLDLTISPAELYHKYKEGRIHPIPFVGGPTSPLEKAEKAIKSMAFFLPVGVLLAGLSSPFWRRRANWPAVLGAGLGLAALIEFMQLFVFTRFCDATDVITGGAAVLAGWAATLAYRRAQPAVAGDYFRSPPRPVNAAFRGKSPLRLSLLVAWIAVLVFVSWQPFNFQVTEAQMTRQYRRMSFIPFHDYYKQDYLHAFDQILEKTVLFIPAGVLLADPCRRLGKRYAGPLVVLLGIVLAGSLAAGKFFLPTRYTGVTDVIIETLGVWLGFVVARRAQSAAPELRGKSQFSK